MPVWQSPTPDQFQEEIVPRGRPAVLRGIAASWPLVEAARRGREHCIAMLAASVADLPVNVLRAEPEEDGRFHYRPDGLSLNFVRGEASLPAFLADFFLTGFFARLMAFFRARGIVLGRA